LPVPFGLRAGFDFDFADLRERLAGIVVRGLAEGAPIVAWGNALDGGRLKIRAHPR